jgi:CspA family cold shock protein
MKWKLGGPVVIARLALSISAALGVLSFSMVTPSLADAPSISGCGASQKAIGSGGTKRNRPGEGRCGEARDTAASDARSFDGPVFAATGTVKWFDPKKGYGFIRPDDGGKDIFVEIGAVRAAGLDGLKQGDRLDFDLESDPVSHTTHAGSLRRVAPK